MVRVLQRQPRLLRAGSPRQGPGPPRTVTLVSDAAGPCGPCRYPLRRSLIPRSAHPFRTRSPTGSRERGPDHRQPDHRGHGDALGWRLCAEPVRSGSGWSTRAVPVLMCLYSSARRLSGCVVPRAPWCSRAPPGRSVPPDGARAGCRPAPPRTAPVGSRLLRVGRPLPP